MTDSTRKGLAGTRVGIFGKGGCGKSTVTVLLAKVLRGIGYHVSVLDADSTNVGLPMALGLESAPRPLLEYLGGMVFRGGAVTCPVDDPTPLAGADISLETLPQEYVGRTPEGIHVLVAGKIGEEGPGSGCDGPVSKIARDLRIRTATENHLTLLDFKAGFEDSARGVITGLDWALVVVDPTLAAIHMAVQLKEMVEALKSGGLPATMHLESPELVDLANRIYREARIKGVLALLNKVGDQETESTLNRKLAEKGIEPIGVIHEDPSIPVSWLRGTSLDGTRTRAEVEAIAEALEAAEQRHEGSRIPDFSSR